MNYLLPGEWCGLHEHKVRPHCACRLSGFRSLTRWPRRPAAAAVLREHRRADAERHPRQAAGGVSAGTPYLMYGLTEAFRSTYLDPAEVDRRPDSIGKAIPNAEILVVRPDGSRCDRVRKASSCIADRSWHSGTGTTRPHGGAVPAGSGPDALAGPRAGGLVGRHGRRRRGGFPVFRRPQGRDDQDLRLSGQPDRDRRGRRTPPAWCATRSRSASRTSRWGSELCWSRRAARRSTLDGSARGMKAQLAASTWCPSRLWSRRLPRSPNGKFDRVLLREELAT